MGTTSGANVPLVNLISRSVLDFQPRYTRNAFGDFLLGYLTGSTLGDQKFQENYGQNTHSFYFQDSWKATSRFTLTAGLRYEFRARRKGQAGAAKRLQLAHGRHGPRRSWTRCCSPGRPAATWRMSRQR